MAEYIKRIDSIKAVNKQNAFTMTRVALIDSLNSIPAADVAHVVHGRWIEKSAPARKIYFECSHCGAQENKHTAIKGYYCWRCGAKMDGGETNETN